MKVAQYWQLRQLLGRKLADGCWHKGADVRRAVRRRMEVDAATITAVLWEMGGDVGPRASTYRLRTDASYRGRRA